MIQTPGRSAHRDACFIVIGADLAQRRYLMAEVRLSNVSKVFSNGVCALQAADLVVHHQECLALVGPSGSGKTTTLRLVAGLESPTAGEVFFDDQPMNSFSPQARNVAMVFQEDALYPHLSVAQNLSFGLRMRNTPAKEVGTRVSELANRLGIEPLLSRYPHELSGGQRQRVSLGRAMVRRPDVCLFDEPFSSLDPPLREQSRGELVELRQRLATTMIYVTHDHREAMKLGDRVAVIRHGRLQQIDTPDVIYRQPANRFVAEFIGSPPMNFLSGTLHQHKFMAEGHELELPHCSCDGSVLLGIRPEDVSLGGDAEGTLPGRIDRVEFLGRETLAYVRVLGNPWIVLATTGHVAAGDEVKLSIPKAAIHLFRADDDQLRL